MCLEIIISEVNRNTNTYVNQKEKNKYNMISFICGISNMIQRNSYETETDSQTQGTDLWLPRGSGWGGIDWEFEVS